MHGRPGRLVAVVAVALLVLVAAAAGTRLSLNLHAVAAADSMDAVTPGTVSVTPTRVKAAGAKHGRTAPRLPAAVLVGLVAIALYGLAVTGTPTVAGVILPSTWSRGPRAPPALLPV